MWPGFDLTTEENGLAQIVPRKELADTEKNSRTLEDLLEQQTILLDHSVPTREFASTLFRNLRWSGSPGGEEYTSTISAISGRRDEWRCAPPLLLNHASLSPSVQTLKLRCCGPMGYSGAAFAHKNFQTLFHENWQFNSSPFQGCQKVY